MKTNFGSRAKGKSLLWLCGLLCFALLSPGLRAQQAPPAGDPGQQYAGQTIDPNGQPNGQPGPGDPSATDPSNADPAQDPPSRVARVSFLDGTVSFQPGGQGDWGSAARNRPVTIGDKLWTDKASRAELQAGEVSIHMGSMTALSFLNLDAAIMQVRIPEGAINFRVRELREGDVYEIDTPNLAFTVKQAGAFRVNVSENGDATSIVAIRGEGEVTTGGKTYTVHAGELAEFEGADNPQYHVTAAPAPDGLDRWAAERDLREDNSTTSKYVSPEVPGRADLDDNGEWNEEPDYGPVWYPAQVSPDWAPYSDGAWNYVGPWGWTWVGYEPWGFAPYHYGRWSYIGSRWGWCPGPYYARPFYGPAFVGFIGGARFGVGFGFGAGAGIGWFPLGFHEPYYPGFRASRGYITNINVHNTVIRNVNTLNASRNFNYAYAHNTRAVTATSRSSFVGGQSINRGANHITAASLRGGEVSNRAGFTPTRASSFGAANMNARSTPPAAVQNRAVMARTSPAAAAARQPVQRLNTGNSSSGPGNNTALANRGAVNGNTNASRQAQLSQGRPQSANVGAANNRSANSTNGRSWEAQGNSTDRGNAPQGFGSSNRANNGAVTNNGAQTRTRTDRPPWAGTNQAGAAGARGNASAAGTRTGSAYEGRANSSYANGANQSGGRGSETYGGSARSYDPPSRSYSSPRSSYPSSSRSYSAPASAPSHTQSAPSHSSGSGGGAASHSGGGGGASHGGGGPHGGGHR
jgi:hypothetical protein